MTTFRTTHRNDLGGGPLTRRSSVCRHAALLIVLPGLAHAQARLEGQGWELTLEGYLNATAASASGTTAERDDGADAAFNATGLRALGRVQLDHAPDLGVRINVESFELQVRLTEASVLVFGRGGRLEIGERMGLPDVLTGYAPNNFTFTGAEYGPASGPSLDPAGGLQLAFLDAALAQQLGPLTALGFAATLFADQSAKILYVSPKSRGFLGGVSYAPDADDARYGGLVQLGLTRERYWAQNVLRWGGSYTFAEGDRDPGGVAYDDLHSFNAGVAATLNDSLMLGFGVTFDGSTGMPAARGTSASSAWGATASVNYNTGPWTLGAYAQFARAEGDVGARGDDRLAAMQIGASYRFSTRLRFYGAWFHYDFADEGSSGALDGTGDVVLAGMRLAL